MLFSDNASTGVNDTAVNFTLPHLINCSMDMLNATLGVNRTTPSEEYYENFVLEQSAGFTTPGNRTSNGDV